MKKRLLTILMLLFAAFSIGTLSAQKNIMFITDRDGNGGPLGEDRQDSNIVALLIDYGYSVTIITDEQTRRDSAGSAVEAALAACDAIIVSQTVSGSYVSGDSIIMYSDKPLLTWEQVIWADMGMVRYDGSDIWNFANPYITIESGADPALVGDLFGDVEAVTLIEGEATYAAAAEFDSLAPGVEILATTFGYGEKDTILNAEYVATYFIVKPGSILVDGTESARLNVAWWFTGDAGYVTDLGWELFRRAVIYTLGDAPATGITLAGIEGKSASWYSNGYLYLDIAGKEATTEIKIFDITGKLVLQKQVSVGTLASVPMQDFAKGVYVVVGDTFAEKFVTR